MGAKYLGKVCVKHPELGGERYRPSSNCVRCNAVAGSKWKLANKDKMVELHKNWYDANKEQRRASINSWRTRNPDAYRAQRNNMTVKRHRLIGGQAISANYATELIEIYKNCPPGHHVDHQIPLRGKRVSGLHVPWNLQYLPASLNVSKGNKLEENI